VCRASVLALDVQLERAGLLRLVVTMGALLPLHADIVPHGLVRCDADVVFTLLR